MSKNTQFTFFEHLEELRKRLIISFGAITLGGLASYCYSDKLLHFLLLPIRKEINQVYFFSPADAFMVRIKIALLAGLILASPIVAGQIWLFISPALYEREKKFIPPLIILTSGLFIAGALFSFFFVVPLTLQFFMSMQTEFLRPMISINECISFLSGILLAFGVAFNLPIFVMGFVLVGVFDTTLLNKFQRHVIVLIFILAAALTPGPDIASQLFLAVPLIILFELSVLGAWVIELFRKKDQKRLEYV